MIVMPFGSYLRARSHAKRALIYIYKAVIVSLIVGFSLFAFRFSLVVFFFFFFRDGYTIQWWYWYHLHQSIRTSEHQSIRASASVSSSTLTLLCSCLFVRLLCLYSFLNDHITSLLLLFLFALHSVCSRFVDRLMVIRLTKQFCKT